MSHDLYTLVAAQGMLRAGCTKESYEWWLNYDGDLLDDHNKNYLETITKPFVRLAQSVLSENTKQNC